MPRNLCGAVWRKVRLVKMKKRKPEGPELYRILHGEQPIKVLCYVSNTKEAEILERFLGLVQLSLVSEQTFDFKVEVNLVEVVKRH